MFGRGVVIHTLARSPLLRRGGPIPLCQFQVAPSPPPPLLGGSSELNPLVGAEHRERYRDEPPPWNRPGDERADYKTPPHHRSPRMKMPEA
ncbi:unnamed protein product [Pleuronectes platessa]|uniref:Uncharacterized protein n=1 Tax=Pleuronectes platessa TaxID=8262 RepID=A0A9N7U0C0_PLEPL|nr:unnamed protein product [Pleuronectes platessa]